MTDLVLVKFLLLLVMIVQSGQNPAENNSQQPTTDPTMTPTMTPSFSGNNASFDPSLGPSIRPSLSPIKDPTNDPSLNPTFSPTFIPTHNPTAVTIMPTQSPLTAEQCKCLCEAYITAIIFTYTIFVTAHIMRIKSKRKNRILFQGRVRQNDIIGLSSMTKDTSRLKIDLIEDIPELSDEEIKSISLNSIRPRINIEETEVVRLKCRKRRKLNPIHNGYIVPNVGLMVLNGTDKNGESLCPIDPIQLNDELGCIDLDSRESIMP